MKWKNRGRIRNWGFSFSLITGKMDVKTIGISSKVPGTALHVVFLDYDCTDDDSLKTELKWIQMLHKLGNFIVLKTSEIGRHAICLDVLKSRETYEVIDSSTCDQMFKKAPIINTRKSWVLRCGKKGDRGAPVYAYTVTSKYEGKNLQSRAHAKFLRNLGVKTMLKRPFGPNQFELQQYYTKNKLI